MKLLLNNKKVKFDYELLYKYEAGIVLTGSEIKSLRNGSASLTGSHCYFKGSDIFINGLRIDQYKGKGNPYREKKLLLHRKELDKIKSKIEQKGLTVVPTKVYIKGQYAKIEIYVSRGKNNYDKRNSIKDRDIKRDQDRYAKTS